LAISCARATISTPAAEPLPATTIVRYVLQQRTNPTRLGPFLRGLLAQTVGDIAARSTPPGRDRGTGKVAISASAVWSIR
jgi:hypothetical protein